MPSPSATWSPTPVRGDVTALAGRELRAVVALQNGEVVASSDGGAEWEVLASLPGRPMVTALLLLPSALLAGTAGRGLWHRDGEGGWHTSPSTPLADRTVLALAHHGGVVLAGTLRAGVFRSTDGGNTWSAASAGLPLLGHGLEVAQFVATPRAWYALHPFGVSESVDGGLRWRSIVAGLPPHRMPSGLAAQGEAVVADVGGYVYRLDASNRWTRSETGPVQLMGEAEGGLFAALADGGAVGRSVDAGHTWSRVHRGLPSGHVVTALGATQRFVLAALDGEGVWSRPVPVEPDAAPDSPSSALPDVVGREAVEATLWANEPNPFDDATSIPFGLSAEATVVLSVHDVSDVEVARLAEGAFPAGRHRVIFEAAALPTGLYHCRLVVGGRRYDRSMVLLR